MAHKKKWFEIISPKVFNEKVIGETLTDDPKKLIGRTIVANAKELTGDYKKSHINIKLEITSIDEDKAITSIKGYAVSRAYLMRFVRKEMSTVNVIRDLRTSDGHKVRIRCMATINNHIKTTKKKIIREELIKEIDKLLGNMTLDNLVFIATTNKIQKMLASRIKKLHPLRFFEIRSIKLLERRIPVAEKAHA